jgi:capsular exopolysaccharide synthesis family protein
MRSRIEDGTAPSNLPALMAMGGVPAGEEELSLTTLWRIVFKHKLVLLSTAALIFCAVVLRTVTKTPVYESVARLEIDPSRTSNLGIDDVISSKLGSGDPSNRLQTEVQVIQSDTVAMRVIDTLGLAKLPAFAGKSAATAKVTNPMAMSPLDRERMLSQFHAALVVKALPNTSIVEVRFRSSDPKLATDVANAVTDCYMERTLQSHYEGTEQVSNWLSKQMQDLQAKAVEAQEKLADFQKKNNILATGTDDNDNIVTDRLKLLNEQLTQAEADRIVKEARYRMAATGNPELIANVVPSTTLQVLRTQEAELKSQLAQLNSKFGSGYPKVHELQTQVSRLDAATATEISNVGKRLEAEYQSAAKTEALLRTQFTEQKDKAYQLNEHAGEYAVLKHDVENGRELYDTLQLKLKMAGVSAGLSSSFINVVDRAEIPARPIEPKPALNYLLGLFGGLLIGFMLVVVIESLDDTLSSSEELELCTGLPVLCSVPADHLAARSRTLHGPAEPEKALLPVSPLLLTHPRSHAAEAFRGLRSSLMLSSPDRQPKIITVVSSVASEGKTTVSTNLGITFAQRGESVLLIDADLRCSAMHTQFGLPNSRYGTSTVLTQEMDDSAIVTPIASLPNLHLMPAGPHPPNPGELLASKRMMELLETMALKYDRIIVDTPPVLAVADSLALANISDAVVLVVRSGVARKKAVLRVRDLLLRANSNLVGTVFNCVNLQLEQYYFTKPYHGDMQSHYFNDKEQDNS